MNERRPYITELRAPADFKSEIGTPPGGVYGGPLIRARNWRQAERAAERLGVIVTGELHGVIDAEDGQELGPETWTHNSSGRSDLNRLAREQAAKASRWRLRLATTMRNLARFLCVWADRVEPCETRRRLVCVRS